MSDKPIVAQLLTIVPYAVQPWEIRAIVPIRDDLAVMITDRAIYRARPMYDASGFAVELLTMLE